MAGLKKLVKPVQTPYDSFSKKGSKVEGSDWKEFKLECEETSQVLNFTDKAKGVDVAPDSIQFGGKTEINVQHYAKEDVKNIQVGRNLDDDIVIAGKILGQGAIFNCNVIESWRRARNKLKLNWNGLIYDVMISESKFNVIGSFDVDYTLTLTVILNRSLSNWALSSNSLDSIATQIKMAADINAKLSLDYFTLSALVAEIPSKDNVAGNWLKYLNAGVGLINDAINSVENLIKTGSKILDTFRRIIDIPRKMINNLRRVATSAINSLRNFYNFVKGFPVDVSAAYQSLSSSTIAAISYFNGVSMKSATNNATKSTLPGQYSVSPASAALADVISRRAARNASVAAASIQTIYGYVRTSYQNYRVVAGETSRSIAKKFGMIHQELLSMNRGVSFEVGNNITVTVRSEA